MSRIVHHLRSCHKEVNIAVWLFCKITLFLFLSSIVLKITSLQEVCYILQGQNKVHILMQNRANFPTAIFSLKHPLTAISLLELCFFQLFLAEFLKISQKSNMAAVTNGPKVFAIEN